MLESEVAFDEESLFVSVVLVVLVVLLSVPFSLLVSLLEDSLLLAVSLDFSSAGALGRP